MKKMILCVFLFLFICSLGYSVSVDIKTKMLEKADFTAIKVGATYFLYKKGITVTEVGEDYTVWLKNLEREPFGPNWYSYDMVVKVSFPSAIVEKRALKQDRLHFELKVSEPLEYEDEGFLNHLAKHLKKTSERLRR